MNTQFNTRYKTFTSSPKEHNILASETRPDESLTIPEILARYIRQGANNVDTSYPQVATVDDGIFDDEMNFGREPAPAPAKAPAEATAEAPVEATAEAQDSTK